MSPRHRDETFVDRPRKRLPARGEHVAKLRKIEDAVDDIADLFGRCNPAYKDILYAELAQAGGSITAYDFMDLYYVNQVVADAAGAFDFTSLSFFNLASSKHPWGRQGTNMPDDGRMPSNKVFVGDDLGFQTMITTYAAGTTPSEKRNLDDVVGTAGLSALYTVEGDNRDINRALGGALPFGGSFTPTKRLEVMDSHDPAVPNPYVSEYGNGSLNEHLARKKLVLPIVLIPMRLWHMETRFQVYETGAPALAGSVVMMIIATMGLMITTIGGSEKA